MFDQVVSSTLDVLRICVGVLRLLQKTMGHASITVTTHYADLYDNSTTSPRHSMPSTMPAATFRNHPRIGRNVWPDIGRMILNRDGAMSTIPGRKLELGFRWWSRLVSNQRPSACEADALPLSYETREVDRTGRTTSKTSTRGSLDPNSRGRHCAHIQQVKVARWRSVFLRRWPGLLRFLSLPRAVADPQTRGPQVPYRARRRRHPGPSRRRPSRPPVRSTGSADSYRRRAMSRA